ncbi:hypothetical protein L596_014530 [Steinernema carpocapsae]|uniref:Uncharacterized protein n=1 Tax=Steinernema carpocapsae TaxID=34508 RepID=A0A4U5ND02_STECR|nr:hypothetical protein L596_014530 [Steinernema carpocapsae]
MDAESAGPPTISAAAESKHWLGRERGLSLARSLVRFVSAVRRSSSPGLSTAGHNGGDSPRNYTISRRARDRRRNRPSATRRRSGSDQLPQETFYQTPDSYFGGDKLEKRNRERRCRWEPENGDIDPRRNRPEVPSINRRLRYQCSPEITWPSYQEHENASTS